MKRILRAILIIGTFSLLYASAFAQSVYEYEKKDFLNGSLSYPKIVNLENKFISDKVNKQIEEGLRIADLSARIESGLKITLSSEASVHFSKGKPSFISIKAFISDKAKASLGVDLVTLNFDLLTGEKIESSAFFKDFNRAGEKIKQSLDSYLEDKVFLDREQIASADVDNIYVSDSGIELFYKNAKNLSGKPFSYQLFDYELEGLLSEKISELDSRRELSDKKERLNACLKNGKFDFLPIGLSDKTETLYNKFSKLQDSEAFVDGARIFLEDARFRDIELIQRKNTDSISGILLKRGEIAGLKIKKSVKEDVLKAFGETASLPFDEALNEYYGLEAQELLVYNGEGKALSLYFSEGILTAVYLSID